MKKVLASAVSFCTLFCIAQVSCAKETSGKELFDKHCAVCHPDGGNTVNPRKTLQKKVREANGVRTAQDIIGKMRNPGPGMPKFDANTIPDKDAKKIADYILKTF